MIEVKELTKKYGHTTAVDAISFAIQKGEVIGLLGPNGAGKTTTIRMLTGYMSSTSGQVHIAGKNIASDSLSIRRKLGYLSENAPLYEEMTVHEYLMFAAQMQDVPAHKCEPHIAYVVKTCGLSGRLNQEIRELSKGYRQRVGLAQSLVHDPEILILDEPTIGLDPNQKIEMRSLIKEIGKEKTILLSSHILSEVEATCNRVLIIHHGKIVASGTPRELASHTAQAMRRVFLVVEEAPQDINEKLIQFPGVRGILSSRADGVITSIEIETEQEKDIRKDLLKFLIHEGYDLLELYQEEQSLEDVFVQLTRD